MSVAEAVHASVAVEVASVAVVLSYIVRCEYAKSGRARGLLSVSQSVERAVEREANDCFVLVAVTTWRVSRAGVFERLMLCHIVGGSLCTGGTSTTGTQRVSRL